MCLGSRSLVAVALATAAALLAACELPEAPEHLSGPIAAPAGCPQLPQQIADLELDGRHPQTGGVTAAREVTATDVWGRRATQAIDARGVAEFFLRFHDTFPVQAEGRLHSIGVDVEVRSDAPIQVDLAALDELAETMLTIAYPDPRFSVLIDCYRRRALSYAELEDRTLRIYVPADPTACFQGGVVQPRAGGGCDAMGAAVPEIRLGPRFAGIRPASLTWPAVIFITPGQHSTHLASVEERAARITVHELMHFLDNEMGLSPHPAGLREYEQRAYYAERVVERAVARGDLELPIPFTWHRRILPEVADDDRR